ncbi:hypothetical protein Bca4012_027479 [Brassica carinata]
MKKIPLEQICQLLNLVAKAVDENNKTLQPIHKTDADDENWISIDADDVKNAHAKVTETAASPRLDGTELRKVIAAMVQSRARKEMMAQPKPLCKTEPIHKTDASAENFVNAPEVKNAHEDKNVVAGGILPLDNGNIENCSEKVVSAQEPTEPVSQPDGANKSLVAKLKQLLS